MRWKSAHLGGALMLALFLAPLATPAALAWQNELVGKPTSYSVGGPVGFYIWQDRVGLHLRTTGPDNTAKHMTGTLTTDGGFNAVRLYKRESGDTFTMPSPQQIDFDFTTYNHEDGLDFRVRPGTTLTLDLKLDGSAIDVGSIYVGHNNSHPSSNPFTVYVNAWGTDVQGVPSSLRPGGPVGYYIWSEDNLWHIRTTGPDMTSKSFTGTISTDGTIKAIRLVRGDPGDSYSLPTPGEIDFTFTTRRGVDGLDFTIPDGTQLTFTLNLDGAPIDVALINLGRDNSHPATPSFTITRPPL